MSTLMRSDHKSGNLAMLLLFLVCLPAIAATFWLWLPVLLIGIALAIIWCIIGIIEKILN